MPDIPTGPTPELPRPSPEVGPLSPETKAEHPVPVEPVRETTSTDIVVNIPVPVQPPIPTPSLQTELQHKVENVLAEGLTDVYRQLDPAKQAEVKNAGEQTANRIVAVLQQAKVQAKNILDLIVSWLRLIPGLNRHYLEQEAKIKADKVLALRQDPPQ